MRLEVGDVRFEVRTFMKVSSFFFFLSPAALAVPTVTTNTPNQNPKPQTQTHQPQTQNPKPQTCSLVSKVPLPRHQPLLQLLH